MTTENSTNTTKFQLNSIERNAEELNNGRVEATETELVEIGKNSGLKGLAVKLLFLFFLFFAVCEILVLVPYAAQYRDSWVMQKFDEIYSLLPVFNELNTVPHQLQDNLLHSSGAIAVAVTDEKSSQRIVIGELPQNVAQTIDLNNLSFFKTVIQTLNTIIIGGDRTLRLTGASENSSQGELIVVLSESALKADLMDYVLKQLTFSLLVVFFAGIMAYCTIQKLVVRPIVQLTENMKQFAENPHDESLVIQPPAREDELGQTFRQMERLQRCALEKLRQHSHLANMGMSIAKINHDLRNLLAVIQFLFEGIEGASDTKVQKTVSRIQTTLNHAVSYAEMILSYGKQREMPLERKSLKLCDLVREAGDAAVQNSKIEIDRIIDVSPDISMDADHGQMFRVLVNLLRNSIQAMESNGKSGGPYQLKVEANREGKTVKVRISDTGPGVPEAVRSNLFKAFQTHGKSNGTGLGLTIASELIQAHGGGINLLDSEIGAVFEFWIPDRPADIETVANQNFMEPKLA